MEWGRRMIVEIIKFTAAAILGSLVFAIVMGGAIVLVSNFEIGDAIVTIVACFFFSIAVIFAVIDRAAKSTRSKLKE